MEKKNNNGLIIVLVGLVIILAVLCFLFASGKINLNNIVSEEKKINDNEVIDNNNDNNDIYNIAVNLGDKLYKNLYSFNSTWVFCGENMKWYNENDYIPYEDADRQGMHKYDVSQDFKSLEELNNYFKSFMSDNLINKYYRTESGIYAYKDGKYTSGVYLEKDGKLYCMSSNKDHGFINYEKENSNYRVINSSDAKIDVVANVGYFEKGSNMVNETEILSYSLIKENDNWKIKSFVIIPDGIVWLRSLESYFNDIIDYNNYSDNKISIIYNDKEYSSKEDLKNIVKSIEDSPIYVAPNGEKTANFNIIYNEKGYVTKISVY